MKISNITFVTGNSAKARETGEILNTKLEIASIDLDEIQDLDVEKIALHKLDQAYSVIKNPVIIDDVSLHVDVWGGFPGPFIKWILEVGNGPSLLLKMLEKEKNRKAIARLIVGYYDGKKKYLFKGEMTGKISKEIRGDNGFGWDRVFIPDGYKQTFAEMGRIEKNKVSHRKKALDKLRDFLKSNYDI